MVMKLKTYRKLWRGGGGGTIIAVCFLLLAIMATATVRAAAVSNGYRAGETLNMGVIVSSDINSLNVVKTATILNLDYLLGVVVDAESTSINIVEAGSDVQVASSGTADVLVTDTNGAIASGDFITVSQIAGLGAKASAEAKVIGLAQAGFDPAAEPGSVEHTETIADGSRQQREVNIGRIPVLLKVGPNPTLKENAKVEPFLPVFIQETADTLAGEPVSPWRAVVSFVVFIVTMASAMFLLYGGVRSAITSIGRNPLSERPIYRGLLQVVAVSGAILFGGLAISYLLVSL